MFDVPTAGSAYRWIFPRRQGLVARLLKCVDIPRKCMRLPVLHTACDVTYRWSSLFAQGQLCNSIYNNKPSGTTSLASHTFQYVEQLLTKSSRESLDGRRFHRSMRGFQMPPNVIRVIDFPRPRITARVGRTPSDVR